jgi:hypothetical protein
MASLTNFIALRTLLFPAPFRPTRTVNGASVTVSSAKLR